jgi:large subunit ribosomal protein L44
MNAARTFVHSYFLTRHVDIPGMLNFRNPKHVLGVEMRRLGLSGGIESRFVACVFFKLITTSGERLTALDISCRLLAESGRHSISPVFSVGLFLPSGLKLAEGTGSSLKMAEHRASINALSSIYLVRAEFTALDGAAKLPTSIHADFPIRFESQGDRKQLEKDYKGNMDAGMGEGVFDTASGKKKWRGTTRS